MFTFHYRCVREVCHFHVTCRHHHTNFMTVIILTMISKSKQLLLSFLTCNTTTVRHDRLYNTEFVVSNGSGECSTQHTGRKCGWACWVHPCIVCFGRLGVWMSNQSKRNLPTLSSLCPGGKKYLSGVDGYVHDKSCNLSVGISNGLFTLTTEVK